LTPLKSLPYERFKFLDAMRAFGALGIVFYHIHRYRPLKEPVDRMLPDFIQSICLYGWIGVQMFWVLSGFMAAYSLRNAVLRPRVAGNFMLRRVVRLGMTYWAVILSVAALDLVIRQMIVDPDLTCEPISWVKLGANLLFLQDILGYGNISVGTWFVCVDLQMSLMFVVLMMLVRPLSMGGRVGGTADVLALSALFLPWGLLSLFGFCLDHRYNAWIIYFFFMPLLGAMAWWAIEGRIPKLLFWSYVAVMLVATVLRWQQYLYIPRTRLSWPLETSLATTIGVVIYLVGRRGHLGDWLAYGWLQYVGRISYSLFLIHYPVCWCVLYLGCRWTGDHELFAVIWLLVAFTTSVLFAHWLYKLVEAPSLRLSARIKRWNEG
jgi:peptidoglycan/LPS O-acetylase OafA/YrhL